MPLLLGRVRGNSATGPGCRAPSFPCKRVGGAPGSYEGQIRKNRTRSYMNGSYGVLTEFLRMSVILTYFATETATATDTERWKLGITNIPTL